MNGTMAFLLGAGGLSAIIYWLTTRTENISARRRSSASDRYGEDYSYSSSSGSSGWNISNLFSSDNSSSSSDNCSSDNSSSSSDSCSSGGGDSGGGGDGGGGGGD